MSTITLDLHEPGSNGNEEVLHTPQSSRTGASQLDTDECHNQDKPYGVVLWLCKGYIYIYIFNQFAGIKSCIPTNFGLTFVILYSAIKIFCCYQFL